MRLTSFTDFGLRALMRLAGEPGRSFATNEIAAEFGISRNHLAKVVRDLADSGFITTQRGVGGGFTLARPAQSITIGEVVRALEGPPLVECFREDGGSCVLRPRCRLKAKLAAAREAFMRELDATTLAECAYPASARPKPGTCVRAAGNHDKAQVQRMKPIEFENGAVQIDAAIVAEGLGLAPALLQEAMRAGRITGVAERGVDVDSGRHRLTFFSEHRRFRVVVDEAGAILQRSAVDFGDLSLPTSVRKSGG